VGQAAGAGDADPEFELCYSGERGAERREFPASWQGLRPERFLPVREFRWTRGQGHLPGLWWAATTGAHVGFESWLERPVDRTNPRPEFSGPSGRLLRKVASSALVFVHGPSQAGPACVVISVVRFVTSWEQT
jgi:hypothetical protein